ncbi:hypothetical protein Q1695_000149 [Nippostrongylus brasiliensis]|nr:hypothetical protein Q1695_000149 [Nippostrongylus brasiliensis]
MDQLNKLVARLETVTVKLENLGASKPQLAPKPAHLSASGECWQVLREHSYVTVALEEPPPRLSSLFAF